MKILKKISKVIVIVMAVLEPFGVVCMFMPTISIMTSRLM